MLTVTETIDLLHAAGVDAVAVVRRTRAGGGDARRPCRGDVPPGARSRRRRSRCRN